jgi:signal transduction histidine kinase
MDPSTKHAGDGLTGMRDRIGAAGGTIHILSSPGHGTTVSGTVPVDEPHPRDLATRSAHPA